MSAAMVPDREALVSGDGQTRTSYEAMATRVKRLTNGPSRRRLGPGKRLAVLATNSPAYVEVYYACARLGACLVPLNYRAKTDELAYMLEQSEADFVCAEARYRDLLEAVRPRLSRNPWLIPLDDSADGLETLIAGSEDEENFAEVDESEPTALLFTFGTTALPKG